MNLDRAKEITSEIEAYKADIPLANAVELRALRLFRKDFEDKQTAAGDIARELAKCEKNANSLLQICQSNIDTAKAAADVADKQDNRIEELRQKIKMQCWKEVKETISAL